MAKESKDKTSTAVLQYFIMQNRPFAVNDLLQSAQLKDFGKAAVQKTLDQFVVAGKVMEKTYGKQKVYAINQDLVSSPDDLNITEIDAKISELTRQNAEDETFIKKAESELKILNSTLSIAEATSQLKMLCEENETMESKIKDLSQNKVKLSAADFKKACVIKEKTASELRKRKRICGDMLDQILESYPKGKKALLEEVGVETD
ncbi:homologous-pairing protein 2 homolog [Daphnia pulicaria]|uniref:homologous-pairing protein 2 homolog n=1 Tax=Daphnia pulicaria TaxID=35523 RepID=UPI001EEA45BC|nr:homologous-pairing protein 2 homolog [Daphnia pulicaria]